MDRFTFIEKANTCECSSCHQEHEVDDMVSIKDKYFCDEDCACDYVAENIEDYIGSLLD